MTELEGKGAMGTMGTQQRSSQLLTAQGVCEGGGVGLGRREERYFITFNDL